MKGSVPWGNMSTGAGGRSLVVTRGPFQSAHSRSSLQVSNISKLKNNHMTLIFTGHLKPQETSQDAKRKTGKESGEGHPSQYLPQPGSCVTRGENFHLSVSLQEEVRPQNINLKFMATCRGQSLYFPFS